MALMVSISAFSANAQTMPTVTTGPYSLIGARNVELDGLVNTNGSNTYPKIQLSTDSTFNNNIIPTSSDPGWISGQTSGTVGIVVRKINLQLGITYYYRAVAQNSLGIAYGETKSFVIGDGTSSSGSYGSTYSSGYTTNGNTSAYGSSSTSISGPTAPQATTNGPASVSSTSAVLNGSINPDNADTKFWFEFGLTQSFGKKTSVEPAGSGNSWQLVTGNISGLESGRTYYYRVVAQNSFGTALGDTRNFNTSNSTGNVTSSNVQSGGQVLGLTTTSGSTNKTSVTSSKTQSNPRPSFVSLEYSIADNNILTSISDNSKPKPGDQFTYTIIYRNDSQYSLREANLKVIIPSEADYVGAGMEPNRISGNVVEFNLGDIAPNGVGTVSVVVKIKETVKPGVTMIFTSVLGYKNYLGTQLATTSYLTVKVGEATLSVASPLLGLLGSISGMFGLAIFGVVVLIGLLAYWLVKVRNNKDNKKIEDDIFGTGAVPPTFQPISGNLTADR